jgi:predicted nucleic acid-binding Zn finger protein
MLTAQPRASSRAEAEVLEPEAHRVLRARFDSERLERPHVEDRVVVGKRDVQQRGSCRCSHALQVEQRAHALCFVAGG